MLVLVWLVCCKLFGSISQQTIFSYDKGANDFLMNIFSFNLTES